VRTVRGLWGLGWRFGWRQLVTLLTGAVVIVAMVVVAESAQSSAARHQRVQLLVERVRATSEVLAAFTWQALGESYYGQRGGNSALASLASKGLGIYAQLNGTMNELRAADPAATTALTRDANQLYSAGIHLMTGGTGNAPPREAQALLAPALDALDRDSLAAASQQQRVAGEASTRAEVAYVGSMVIGLALLLLLVFRFYRVSRRTLLMEQRRALERRSEERIRALVEHSSDIIAVVGPDLTVRWQSSTVERTLGHPAADTVGRRFTEFTHPEDAELVETQFAAATTKPGAVTFTARFQHADGGWRHLEAIAVSRLGDPAIEGVLLSMRDISERKALEDELRHQAFHDTLTGLANRTLFEDRLVHALAGARRHGDPLAVLFLDVDDFKTINDSLGHATGDELLRSVAKRIAGVIRTTDTAARLGGDEFAVLLEIMDDDNNGELAAARLLEALAPPFQLPDRELRIGASIGVCTSDGSLGVAELLRNADTAMYAAKEAGKGRMYLFEEGMHQRVLERLELTGELQRALELQQFEIDYQPIVDLEQGWITGAEALVRWAHPTRGRLPPAQFIGLAEETGLIVPLGTWILNAACCQGAKWQQDFPDRTLQVNVNVSTRQLQDPVFPQIVAAALRDSGLQTGRLVLEITESLLPDDSEQIIDQLHKLKALGVLVAVDDFGTGYSALSRLQTFPVDILKIDRAFINSIEHDGGDGQLVQGIINLAQSLHMDVVAEGIEEHRQLDQLRRLHASLGQGFLLSRPVSADRLQALLSSGSPCWDNPKDPRATLSR
jgi:diguanylate cyclase (GGDEF)-like protein/PAS domain S-box-containing protein